MNLGEYFSHMTISQVMWSITIPVIAAWIGWFTNYIAIKMLFYPRVKKRYFGIYLHGVFPKRQKELGAKLGELFAEKLGVQKQLENEVKSVVDLESLKTKLDQKVNETAIEFLNTEMPFLAPMLPKELLDSLSLKVSSKLFTELEAQFDSSMKSLSQKVDVKSIVEREVVSLQVEQLEVMLQDLLKKEFRFIELSGAILGFLIGCIQLALTSFI